MLPWPGGVSCSTGPEKSNATQDCTPPGTAAKGSVEADAGFLKALSDLGAFGQEYLQLHH